MPRASLRTKARKRLQVRLPGSRSTIHYKKEKVKRTYCPKCGQALVAMPRLTPLELRKLSPSQRKIERPFGGQLCHNCLRELIKQSIRTAVIHNSAS